jgi:hypothetical protein
MVMVQHGEETAKEASMIDRKAGGGALLHGLMLHYGTKDFTSRWKVDGARDISFVLD